MHLTVRCTSDPAELPALATAWDALIDEQAPGAVFRSAAWLLPWWKHFSPGKELRIYVARSAATGRLVGVLPAYRVPTPLGGSRLRLMGDDTVGSDYLGVIARPEDQGAATRAIVRALAAEEHDLCFNFVAEDDPLVEALRHQATRDAGQFTAAPLLPCPYLDITAAGDFRRWRDGLPRGGGAQLVRRRRWLERRPDFALEVVTEESKMVGALATLWQLHQGRWAREGGSDAVDRPEVIAFHAEAGTELARRGWARVYLLHVEGAARAALYGFERGGRFAYYQSGNEPAWRQRSVGTVVLGAAIEDAFARGLCEFDFLHGDEAYKSTFAASRRWLLQVRVATGARARAQWAMDEGFRAGRQLVRKHLPPGAVAWVQRTRRRLRREVWT
ncbi:MAG TPA: GNAT family N-acetyltransferase [Polyangia bacterium]|jgi:CelD/BcsL family acetyltransferase involved in cellulose biosynthesis|nr:GNAT family N-acetyltransferase [Polyangia bacterium]